MNEGLDSGTDAASGFAAGTRTAPSYACLRRRHAELRAHNCHDSMAQIHEFSLRPNCWCARDGVRSYTNYTGPRRGAARTARKVRIEVGVTLRERAATRPARPHDVSPTVGNNVRIPLGFPRLIVRTGAYIPYSYTPPSIVPRLTILHCVSAAAAPSPRSSNRS